MADILSQAEVDLLLTAVGESEAGAGEERDKSGEAPRLTTYDFRRPERVSKDQLKGLQSLFEAFSREVSIAFSPLLRTVVRVDLVSIDQLTYDEFILSVARPTALVVVDMSPLEGKAVFELNPGVIFPIVDRVLGGKGHALSEARELTEIESRILTRIVLVILESLRTSWDQLIEFHTSILTIENDPLIVQIVAGGEMVVMVGYEVHIGEAVGSMNICLSLATLTPILEQISSQAHYARKLGAEDAVVTRSALVRTVTRARVPVDAILGHVVLPLHEIARLQVGDTVQLDSVPQEPITVEVGGIPRFFAQPGRRGEQSAVQVTDLIRE